MTTTLEVTRSPTSSHRPKTSQSTINYDSTNIRTSTRSSSRSTYSRSGRGCSKKSPSEYYETISSSSKSQRGRPQTSASTRTGAGGSGRGDAHSLVVAVIEGRALFSNIHLFAFVFSKKSKISDSQTYVKTLHKMSLYNPMEILLSITAVEPSMSKLCKILEENIPTATITPIGRKFFNDEVVWSRRRCPCLDTWDHVKICGSFPLRNCRLTILLTTLDILRTHGIFFSPAIQCSSNTKDAKITKIPQLDCAAARNLELIANISNPKNNHSLYGVLNNTGTPMGARLFRTNILQPLTDLATINTRLDSELFFGIQGGKVYFWKESFYSFLISTLIDFLSALKPFQDIDHLITSVPRKPTIKHAEQSLNNVIMLRHTLKLIAQLRANLGECQTTLLTAIFKARHQPNPRLHEFDEFINQVINEDATYQKSALGLRNQRCYAVKAGFNGLLDVGKIVQNLIVEICKNIGVLYKASESIAMLDMLTSFAHQCTISDYVRPEFTDTLAIKSGRHPMRESLFIDKFIPNDTYASNATNFQLITGPNMSGKSTYLRQIALMCIMSQIGSLVPAEYASFRIVDQLFTRISNDDDMETNASSFIVEMRETAYILQNITDNSLVIIDELGRATSIHDGLGITHAAFVFFATHFHELTRSLIIFPNVVNLHLEVEIADGENHFAMKYMYRVKDGRNDDEHYGLKFGQLVGLPEDAIQKASEVSHKLKQLIDSNKEKSNSHKIRQRRKTLLQPITNKSSTSTSKLTHHLLQVKRSSNLDKDSIRRYLKMVQEEFVAKMEQLL
ncbi:hypothetical protein G9A89_016497 [Geosiphon pyriformis]|nr:hypothetical protein G9A89_016497 [Geosiphon pyriformis]